LFGTRNNAAHRLLLLFNAGDHGCEFSMPAVAARWRCRFDTARPTEATESVTGFYPMAANSCVLLEC
jgi:pullulanase/glycogen debranching enzyme